MKNSEYKIVTEVCNNICNDSSLRYDLIQEVSLIFLELPQEKKDKIRKYFRYWVVRVVLNNWRSSSSVFWNKYRKSISIDPNDIYNLSEDQPEIEEKFCPSELLSKLISELYISDQNVFKDYYYKGLTIVQITEKYHTEKTYTWTVLDRIRTSIKRRVDWLEEEPDFTNILVSFLFKKRLNVKERQLIADIHNHTKDEVFNEIHNDDKVICVLEDLVLDIFI